MPGQSLFALSHLHAVSPYSSSPAVSSTSKVQVSQVLSACQRLAVFVCPLSLHRFILSRLYQIFSLFLHPFTPYCFCYVVTQLHSRTSHSTPYASVHLYICASVHLNGKEQKDLNVILLYSARLLSAFVHHSWLRNMDEVHPLSPVSANQRPDHLCVIEYAIKKGRQWSPLYHPIIRADVVHAAMLPCCCFCFYSTADLLSVCAEH
mmetsp:Transcript_27711/g.70748  ORF Transcript_27711/g.70748 Transcript_27711/m.70748 type:complete len:206 (-) Transcript_27711:180-797(-)